MISLCADYAECVDLLRKLFLTGVLGIIPAGTVLQSFCSVVISLFFLAMHVWMWVSCIFTQLILKLHFHSANLECVTC